MFMFRHLRTVFFFFYTLRALKSFKKGVLILCKCLQKKAWQILESIFIIAQLIFLPV